MQKLKWINSEGEELDLTSGNFGITQWEGFSAAELNVQSQNVPFVDGSVYLDSLIGERTLTVTLAIWDGGNLETRYRLRRELISKLNPKLDEGYLIYKNDFLEKRIKCIAELPIFENHNSDDAGTPKASLSWTCCNPYWEDVEETELVLQGGQRATVENISDVCCPIKAEYTGFDNSIRLENLSTEKAIQVDSLGTHRRVDICTENGNKTVYAVDLSAQEKYTAIDCDYIQKVDADNLAYFKVDTDANKTYMIIENDGELKRVTFNEVLGQFGANGFGGGVNAGYNEREYNRQPINYSETQGKYFVEYYDTVNSDYRFFESTDLLNWAATTVAYCEMGGWYFRWTAMGGSNKWEMGDIALGTFTDITSYIGDVFYYYDEDNGYYSADNNNGWIFQRGTRFYAPGSWPAGSRIYNYSSPLKYWGFASFNGLVIINGNYGAYGTCRMFEGQTDKTMVELVGIWTVADENYFNISAQNIGVYDKNYNNYKENLKIDGQYASVICEWNGEYILWYGDVNVFGYTSDFQKAELFNQHHFTGITLQNNTYYGYEDSKLYYSVNLERFYSYADCPQVDYFADGLGAGDNTGFELINGNVVPFSHPCTSVRVIRKMNNKYYICCPAGLYESTDKQVWTQTYAGDVYDVSDNGQNVVIITDTDILKDGNTVANVPDTFKKLEWSDYYKQYILISDTTCYTATADFIFTLVSGVTGDICDVKYDEQRGWWWILTDEKVYTFFKNLLSEVEINGTGYLVLSKKGCLAVNDVITEIEYKTKDNLISHLSADSDMSFCLKRGRNTVIFTAAATGILQIKYRNLFVGV